MTAPSSPNAVAGTIRELLDTPPDEVRRLHATRINPTLVEALGALGYGRDLVRADGVKLWDAAGREYLDFVAGYGSVMLGHNHPDVRAAVEEVLRSGSPNFLQVSPQPLAGALADRLCRIAPDGLDVAYLMSSGSEAVDGAMKLARVVTRRPRFVAAERAFHGITCGALSLTGPGRHRDPFGPLLDTTHVPFGDTAAVERALRKRDVAAVVLEPMQGEGGMRPAPDGYLADVARLCKRYGTLLVLDEIQSGLGRTGKMWACEHDGVAPDVLCVAKGLSGGLVPVSAYLTRKDLWQRAYGTLERYDIHSSTYTGGAVACAAAIATLEVLERDRLVARAAELGAHLGEELRAACAGHKLVVEVRGRGLLWGIELRGLVAEDLVAELVAQWACVGLVERGVVTQVATMSPDTVRAEPALVVERAHIDRFCAALRETLEEHARGTLRSLAGVATRFVTRRVSRLLGGTP